jgi:NADH:ubiquinone oxidoreductase subunit 5 (subunit L)/multisubunit Na+/H+ antiporter MnhA subunit
MKAMLVNRVGDFFILLSIFTILVVCGSLEYDVVFRPKMLDGESENLLNLVGFIKILCLMGKTKTIFL